MLQGHVFHSFSLPQHREHPFYLYSQFFGGQAAAVFLVVTGITFGLGMFRRQDLPGAQRVLAALKRARYLFLVAILFRIQLWLFGLPNTFLSDLLIVDVLNLMGVAAAVLSLVALARDPIRRFRWALLAGTLMAAIAPFLTDLDTGSIPKFLRDYLIPSPAFAIFPWGSYLAFGLAAGSVIPLVERVYWSRVMQWAALTGFALILCGLYFAQFPYSIYPSADFWLDSPALVACKMGATLLMAAAAFLWTEYFSTGWSWVRLLGTTSLPVYWVHVELVYGRWFWFYKERLTPWECVAACAVLILLMIAMSLAIRRVPWRAWFGARFGRPPAPAPVPSGIASV